MNDKDVVEIIDGLDELDLDVVALDGEVEDLIDRVNRIEQTLSIFFANDGHEVPFGWAAASSAWTT